MNRIVRIHIAKGPSYPTYGIIVEYSNGEQLWDCDCFAPTEAEALKLARREYPRRKIVMWNSPDHYSNR